MKFYSKKTFLVLLFIVFLICIFPVYNLLIKVNVGCDQNNANNVLQLMNDSSQPKYIFEDSIKYISSDTTIIFNKITSPNGNEKLLFVLVFCGSDKERKVSYAKYKTVCIQY